MRNIHLNWRDFWKSCNHLTPSEADAPPFGWGILSHLSHWFWGVFVLDEPYNLGGVFCWVPSNCIVAYLSYESLQDSITYSGSQFEQHTSPCVLAVNIYYSKQEVAVGFSDIFIQCFTVLVRPSLWCHHFSNLHNTKMSTSLKRKEGYSENNKSIIQYYWELISNYLSNSPQVCVVYRLINHTGCL